jgi:hypothetical protein
MPAYPMDRGYMRFFPQLREMELVSPCVFLDDSPSLWASYPEVVLLMRRWSTFFALSYAHGCPFLLVEAPDLGRPRFFPHFLPSAVRANDWLLWRTQLNCDRIILTWSDWSRDQPMLRALEP